MPFTLYVRTTDLAVHHYKLETQKAAVLIACALMKRGVKVERIEYPDGEKLDADAIRALGEM